MNRISCVLVLTLAAACGGSGSSQVALSARAGTAASTAATATGQQAQPLTLVNGIVITRLRVVLNEVKLEGTASTDAGTGEEVEFKTAPTLLDLSGSTLDNGTTQQVTLSNVKPGTYREIKFKIHKPSQSDAGVAADAGLAAMANQGFSMIVDGTIDAGTSNAKTFAFSSALEAQQQVEGTFNFTDGSHGLTLNLDATTWFGGTGSSRLDPTVAANKSQIENNIKASFKAFQDDDHDGHEDHR
jgi:hypothetical protein